MKEDARRRAYCREAALALLLSRWFTALLPPSVIFAWADRAPSRPRRFSQGDVPWIAWAIQEQSREIGSLIPALAIHGMLRRRGIASVLCMGVIKGKDQAQPAAWVETKNGPVIEMLSDCVSVRIAEFGRLGE